jgi:16S rRNA (guanine1207-N2)-methyltransferase
MSKGPFLSCPLLLKPSSSKEFSIIEGVYNRPDPTLVHNSASAVELSPLIPGSAALEDRPDASFDFIAMLAPQGVLERRFAMAHALRALKPGGAFAVLAAKDRGGTRLFDELSSFGCDVTQTARRHHRICSASRPLMPTGLDDAIAQGAPRILPGLNLWTQPGIFSWDRTDKGTAILLSHLPSLAGSGADFGCGAGLLARAVLQGASVARLFAIDTDRRAIDAARRNIADPRVVFAWHDLRQDYPDLRDLDFVVMNPPFHDGGAEDRALGQTFIRRAAAALKPGGVCWLVANRHLPYEAALKLNFSRVRQIVQDDGYKIYEARR